MKWLEILHLRSNADQSLESISELVKQALVNDQISNSQNRSIYRRQMVEGDLSVILEFKFGGEVKPPSDLGLRLSSSLREFGRVDHSVWLEM